MNRGTMLAGALALLGAAGGAMGSVTITSVHREVFSTVKVDGMTYYGIDSDEFESQSHGFFSHAAHAEVDVGGNFVQGIASQTSLVSTSEISASIEAFGQNSQLYSMTDVEYDMRTRILVSFTVHQQMQAIVSGNFYIPISMLNVLGGMAIIGSDGVLFDFDPYWGGGSYVEEGLVEDYMIIFEPGEYTLSASVRLEGITISEMSIGPGMNLSLQFIPAPGSLGLLTFCGLAASRRRR